VHGLPRGPNGRRIGKEIGRGIGKAKSMLMVRGEKKRKEEGGEEKCLSWA
jgi:hypothetical protein